MSDIPRFHSATLNVPRYVRGYGNDEFIKFDWESSLDPSQFRVLVEDLKGEWRSLGSLKNDVYIPNIYFPQHARLVVVGVNRKGEQVRYSSTLRRGQLYVMESSRAGDHTMVRYIPQNTAN